MLWNEESLRVAGIPSSVERWNFYGREHRLNSRLEVFEIGSTRDPSPREIFTIKFTMQRGSVRCESRARCTPKRSRERTRRALIVEFADRTWIRFGSWDVENLATSAYLSRKDKYGYGESRGTLNVETDIGEVKTERKKHQEMIVRARSVRFVSTARSLSQSRNAKKVLLS